MKSTVARVVIALAICAGAFGVASAFDSGMRQASEPTSRADRVCEDEFDFESCRQQVEEESPLQAAAPGLLVAATASVVGLGAIFALRRGAADGYSQSPPTSRRPRVLDE